MLLFLAIIDDEKTRNRLEELYYIYKSEMLYVSHSILKDYHEAEDVVQTAIIKLADNLHKIEGNKDKKTRAFIIMVTRNIAINLFNKRMKRSVVNIDDYINEVEDDDISPEKVVLNIEKAEWVAEQLAKVKNEYADILTLKYTYELSNTEIAELTNTSEGNVRVKLMRAKKSLYQIIGGDEIERTS